jgi:hypothetical protein
MAAFLRMFIPRHRMLAIAKTQRASSVRRRPCRIGVRGANAFAPQPPFRFKSFPEKRRGQVDPDKDGRRGCTGWADPTQQRREDERQQNSDDGAQHRSRGDNQELRPVGQILHDVRPAQA